MITAREPNKEAKRWVELLILSEFGIMRKWLVSVDALLIAEYIQCSLMGFILLTHTPVAIYSGCHLSQNVDFIRKLELLTWCLKQTVCCCFPNDFWAFSDMMPLFTLMILNDSYAIGVWLGSGTQTTWLSDKCGHVKNVMMSCFDRPFQ